MKKAMLFMGGALLLTAGGALIVSLQGCADLAKAQAGVGAVGAEAMKAKGESDKAKGMSDQAKAAGAAKGSGDAGPEDDNRLAAKESGLNAPLDDKISPKDKIDWRVFSLAGKPGVATFELHWDEEKAELELDVYNSYGDLIGKSPRKLSGTTSKRVLIQVPDTGYGKYYARVKSTTEKDESIYTLKVLWDDGKKKPKGGEAVAEGEGEKPPAAAAPAAPPPAAAAPAPGTPGAPGAPVTPPPPIPLKDDPSKLLGSIVTAYRDNTGWVLQIDRGASNNLRPGMTGNILEGPEGDKIFEGSLFTISQVVDGSKAIARCNMSKPIGKNKRIVINLK